MKVNDNIDNNVCVHEEFISRNNGVHTGFVQAIENTTKDADPCNQNKCYSHECIIVQNQLRQA